MTTIATVRLDLIHQITKAIQVMKLQIYCNDKTFSLDNLSRIADKFQITSSKECRQNFGGAPFDVLIFIGSTTALAYCLNNIAHSWRKDVVLDTRSRKCKILESTSRTGRLIIISDQGEREISDQEKEGKVANILSIELGEDRDGHCRP